MTDIAESGYFVSVLAAQVPQRAPDFFCRSFYAPINFANAFCRSLLKNNYIVHFIWFFICHQGIVTAYLANNATLASLWRSNKMANQNPVNPVINWFCPK